MAIHQRKTNAITEQSLSFSRPELTDFNPHFLSVPYRAALEITDDKSPEEIEQQLRFVAAQIAPSVLYPFIRETVLTTAPKIGLPPVTLPEFVARD